MPVLRWTIMHEIAHIVLGHISKSRWFERSKRSSSEREWIEREADSFTQRVLCPAIVLHELHAVDAYRIARLCGISRTAAAYQARRMVRLEELHMFYASPQEQKIAMQFRDFITSQRVNP